MAGIGFELRKVLGKGGLGTSAGAALTGLIIVAGPWLLSSLTIFVIRFLGPEFGLDPEGLFQAGIIYCFALSLFLFSGVHFWFTRLAADLLWLQRAPEAHTRLWQFIGWTALGAAGLGLGLSFWLPLPSLADPLGFRLALTGLFVAINILWLMMLFVSLLRRYLAVSFVYLLGMAASIGLVLAWAKTGGPAGALAGFATGHLLIFVSLAGLALKEIGFKKPAPDQKGLLWYLRRYGLLILSGSLFFAGQWLDKFWFWFVHGSPVEGSGFRLFPAYDLAVYIAGLTIIPGLAFFVIYVETAFYQALQKFIHALSHRPIKAIHQLKFHLIKEMKHQLKTQALFQGIISCLSLAVVWAVLPEPQFGPTALAILAWFCLLLVMTMLNFLYYFEFYPEALTGALTFFFGTLVLTPLAAALGLDLPGLSFAVAALLGAGVSLALLLHSSLDLEKRIFRRSAQ